MNRQSEFYVGYLPLPPGLKRHVRRVVVLAAAVAVALVAGQCPFAESTFEFQQYRDFRGSLVAQPYPALVTPGEGQPWLLVG